MVKHSEWRKLAKKSRRKRIRQTKAKLRDQLDEECQTQENFNHKKWSEEQIKSVEYQSYVEAKLATEGDLQLRKVEEESQKQIKLFVAKRETVWQNEKIKLEWKKELKRRKQLEEEKEKKLEEQIRQQEILNEKINDFIINGGDTPEYLKIKSETNPRKPQCPFFQKTSTCRFYDVCSRNHIRPGISRILLIPNFFTHYSLETAENEHGSDSCLEFEVYEIYNCYKEFFYDVIPEMETFGRIKHFKTCCNHEPHLRGNVYVEFFSTRSALKGYKVLNGRWYGGKQLNVEFCNIESWKKAICGLFFVKRCPKGNVCNFLHVFRNPKSLYSNYDEHRNFSKFKKWDDISNRRNWRWSESPENVSSIKYESEDKNKALIKKCVSKSNSRFKRQRHCKKRKRVNSRSTFRTPDSRSRS